MAAKASRSGVIFRPHFKTHQSLTIGRWFREAGTRYITESSLVAAGYFASDGWNDITVAIPVNLREIDQINRLAS
ncbi:MAG: alanine racemase, partial [Bacteroidales bacterium]|nr:alanine racemase [Bacteroidales bacterium]